MTLVVVNSSYILIGSTAMELKPKNSFTTCIYQFPSKGYSLINGSNVPPVMLTPKLYFFNFLSCRVYTYNYHKSTITHTHTPSRAEPRTEYTTKPSTNERIPPSTSPGHSWRNTPRTVHFSLFYSSLTVKIDFHLSYIDPPYVIIGSYPTDTTPIAPPLTF